MNIAPTMNRPVNSTVVVVALVVLVLVMVTMVEARPSTDSGIAAFRRSLFGDDRAPARRSNNQCSDNARKQYLCELCAKQTKSLQVYNLCCDGLDNAESWCESFIGFGITGV